MTPIPPPAPKRSASPFLLGVVATLLTAILWTRLPGPRSASAQIPDSGAQRALMVDELRLSNQKLAEIVTLLREIRDKQAGPPPATPEKKAPRVQP